MTTAHVTAMHVPSARRAPAATEGELVGELETWVRTAGSTDGNAHGAGTTDHGGIPGVHLTNDGVHHFWLAGVGAFRLEYEGSGWLVTNSAFWHWVGRDHYLSSEELPLSDGSTHKLERGVTYEIRCTERSHAPAWDLYKV